jgi:hypothetical protein
VLPRRKEHRRCHVGYRCHCHCDGPRGSGQTLCAVTSVRLWWLRCHHHLHTTIRAARARPTARKPLALRDMPCIAFMILVCTYRTPRQLPSRLALKCLQLLARVVTPREVLPKAPSAAFCHDAGPRTAARGDERFARPRSRRQLPASCPSVVPRAGAPLRAISQAPALTCQNI